MEGTERKLFLDQVSHLLTSQRVGVLATNYNNAPHQSLIAYIVTENLHDIFFITPLYTRKVAAIEQEPHVALLIDNRQNIETDFDSAIAVTAKGMAERQTSMELSRDGMGPNTTLLSRYLDRHPYLEEFASSPSCGFYRIRVSRYTLVSRFQQVEELLL